MTGLLEIFDSMPSEAKLATLVIIGVLVLAYSQGKNGGKSGKGGGSTPS